MLNKKRIAILVCMVITVVATSFAVLRIINKPNNAEVSGLESNFTIVANNIKNSEVSTNTSFTITSNIDYTVEELREKIDVTDNKDFSLIKTGEGTYSLTPKEVLDGDSIFNINISEDNDEPGVSWAFQTESDFSVVSTSPHNGYDYADLNTGIEVEFSKTPEFTENFIEITPKVDGKYESNGKRLIFVPKGLASDTEYTVTVKKGLKSKFGDILEEDYSFNFATKSYNNYIYFSAEDVTTSVNGSKFIKVGCSSEFDSEKFNVKVYKFNNANEYLSFLRDEDLIDINSLTLVSDFESQFSTYTENYYTSKYIMLPDNLETGYYLVDISTGGGFGKTKNRNTKGSIQVTDIATYVQTFNGETLVWCNDISTNEVIKNARVKIGENEKFTDDSGIAIFNTKDGKDEGIIVTDDKNRSYACYEDLAKESDEILDDMYHTYLYTDREVYMPTDTIKFWGVILPKKDGLKVPSEVKISILDEEIILPVSRQGSFSGEHSFINRTSESFSMMLKLDEFSKSLAWKNIVEYVKPAYNITSEYDKDYYKRGDKVTINIEAEYFDETPASNLSLSTSTSSHKETVKTDSNGNAKVEFYPEPREGYGWYPYDLYTTISTADGEEDASSYNSVRYFPTDYMFEAKWENNELKLESNFIDVKDNGDDYEKGLPAEATATVKIFQGESMKTEVGEYYDFINKKNVKKYEYSTKKTELEEFSCDIKGGYTLIKSYEESPDIWYYAEISYSLPDGFKGTTTAYLNNNSHYRYESNSKRYDFSTKTYESYEVNENINIEVLENDEKFLNNGRIIYTVITDKIKDSKVISDTDFSISYIENYIPRCMVVGAYFDGNVLYPIEYRYFYFDNTTRKLDIDISTDKKSYKPGEEVTVNVTAKDSNGVGRKTNMVISVVDEAVFAIEDQYVNPLDKLYSIRDYDENVRQYISHEQLVPFVTAENGGEGGPERSIFKDTAAFIPVTTGTNGQATAKFILPDNLTSWRITAVGVTEDIYAGFNKYNITTNLPFFINQVINLKYTSSDDFTFSTRAVGDEERFLDKNIEYFSTLIGNGISKSLNVSKKYGETAIFNYGKLPEGEYEVYVDAKSGNYSDAIRKTVPVYNSLQEIDISKKFDLSKDINIEALRFPVELKFYDKNNEFYYSIVRKVLSSSYGSTSDQILSRKLTYKKLDEIEGIEREIDNIRVSQEWSGGIRLLPSSDPDVLLTAKISALAPEYIDVNSAKSYFYSIIKNKKSSSNQVSAAYFGLAALKAPVLNDIKYLLQNNKGFEFQDNINFVLGLAFIGDYSGANEYYQKVLSGKMMSEGEYLYVDVGNYDENYEATSRVGMMLTKINNGDFKKVIRYVVDKKSNKYTPAFDLLTYVLSYNPKMDSEGYIEYFLNGENEKVTFNNRRVKTLTLDKEELQSFSIKSYRDVDGFIYYVGGIQDALDNEDNKISVEKTYTIDSSVGDFSIVTVNIKFKNPNPKDAYYTDLSFGKSSKFTNSAPKNTYYTVSDVVPSGMRFVSLVREDNGKVRNWYLDEEENQKLYFSVYNETGEVTLKYKVRSVLPGEYLMESAVVSHSTEDINGYSERGYVRINEK